MTPSMLIQTGIDPALAVLEPLGIRDTREARRTMVAIALQESLIKHRRQVLADGRAMGPAKGYWQFERAGGCVGVLTHRASAERMRIVCEQFDVAPNAAALWDAIQYQDVVAAAAARLLLWTLPAPLPEKASDGWAQYIEAWRPGKPHRHTWNAFWAQADRLTGGTT